jgi:hypothetical protein
MLINSLTNCRFDLYSDQNFDKFKTIFMKTPLLLLGICASVAGTAQTIELEDTLSTGDAMTYYVLDSSATNLEGITGADVVWDYNSVGAYMIPPNDNNVINREDSDFAADFPDARYTEAFDNSVQTYFTNNDGASQVIVHGFVFQELSNDFIIKYDADPLIALQLPMNLGDSYTDDIEGTATVPLAGDISISGEASIEADGIGTLKMGGTDYANVIRVHTTEVSEGIILGSPATITRESFVYYDIDNFNMPIFIHATVLAELGAGGDFGFTAVYAKDEITDYVGLEEESTTPVDLSIYPNPVAGSFTTVSTSQGTEKLTIMNSVGQVVRVINNPQTSEQIDVSDLGRGVYFVQAMKGASTRTEKFIVK